MRLTIEIKMDNDAFGDCLSTRINELMRIFQDIHDRDLIELSFGQLVKLRDLNGNVCGSIAIID